MHLSNERLGRGSVGASPEQRTGHQIDEADAAFVFVDQVVTETVVEAIVERVLSKVASTAVSRGGFYSGTVRPY